MILYTTGVSSLEWVKNRFSFEKYGKSVARCFDSLIQDPSRIAVGR